MLITGSSVRSPISRKAVLVAVAAIGLALVATAGAARPGALTLQGSVKSGDTGLAGHSVSVYAAFVDRKPQWVRLGSDTSDGAGPPRSTGAQPPANGGSTSTVTSAGNGASRSWQASPSTRKLADFNTSPSRSP